MGRVMAIVNVPQGLCASALTTTKPRTAMRMMRMLTMAISDRRPANVPSSSLTISPSDFPLRRIEATRMMKS